MTGSGVRGQGSTDDQGTHSSTVTNQTLAGSGQSQILLTVICAGREMGLDVGFITMLLVILLLALALDSTGILCSGPRE